MQLVAAAQCLLLAVVVHYLLSAVQARRARRARRAAERTAAGAPAILAIGTANPPHKWTIEEYTQTISRFLKGSGAVSDEFIDFFLKRHENCGIETRYAVLPKEDFDESNLSKPRSERSGLYVRAEETYLPTAAERHAVWAEWAPELAKQAATRALESWGGDKRDITHVVFHSCTGFKAPGVELDVIDALGLTGVKRRLGINYMGCFGGFTAMAVAKSFVAAEPTAVVLAVCCEICSVHFSTDEERSEMIGNTIFADGAAAAVFGAGRPGDWALGEQLTQTLDPSTRTHMTWGASNHAYKMRLAVEISKSLGGFLFNNVARLLRDICDVDSVRDVEWVVHPGGVKILDVFQDPLFGLSLSREDLRHSYDTLRDYGNMSSGTIFFVIKHLMEDEAVRKDRAFLLGFGPGLTVELGSLIRIPSDGGVGKLRAEAPMAVSE